MATVEPSAESWPGRRPPSPLSQLLEDHEPAEPGPRPDHGHRRLGRLTLMESGLASDGRSVGPRGDLHAIRRSPDRGEPIGDLDAPRGDRSGRPRAWRPSASPGRDRHRASLPSSFGRIGPPRQPPGEPRAQRVHIVGRIGQAPTRRMSPGPGAPPRLRGPRPSSSPCRPVQSNFRPDRPPDRGRDLHEPAVRQPESVGLGHAPRESGRSGDRLAPGRSFPSGDVSAGRRPSIPSIATNGGSFSSPSSSRRRVAGSDRRAATLRRLTRSAQRIASPLAPARTWTSTRSPPVAPLGLDTRRRRVRRRAGSITGSRPAACSRLARQRADRQPRHRRRIRRSDGRRAPRYWPGRSAARGRVG